MGSAVAAHKLQITWVSGVAACRFSCFSACGIPVPRPGIEYFVPGIGSVESYLLDHHLPMQGVWVPSLVGELRFHILCGQKSQNIKQKQYCNKFNKDFENVRSLFEALKKMSS